jgi:hypothetical protein
MEGACDGGLRMGTCLHDKGRYSQGSKGRRDWWTSGKSRGKEAILDAEWMAVESSDLGSMRGDGGHNDHHGDCRKQEGSESRRPRRLPIKSSIEAPDTTGPVGCSMLEEREVAT